MTDFFIKKQILTCNCAANKNAIYTYTFNDHFGNSRNQENIDILILLEFKEVDIKLTPFLNMCKNFLNKTKYVIIPALGCTPDGFSTQDTINTYSQCKEANIKKIIETYNPKCIITTGRAIYTITESKSLRSEHFFIPVNENICTYQKDDCYFFTKEFNCKVFPIPALYQWIDKSIKDTYEYKFVISQFKLALKTLTERKQRRLKIDLILEKSPNEFITTLIQNKTIQSISIDSESSGLNYFKDTLYSLQFSYNGTSGHFCYFDQIDKQVLIDLFNRQDIIFSMHNCQHDLKFLIVNGITNARCDFDTMLASHLLNENNPNGLKPLSWIYTQFGGYDFELNQYLKKYNIQNFTQLPKQLLLEYSCYDAIITYQLYTYFKNRLELEDSFVKENFFNFIMPAVPMIIDIEMTGVQVDSDYLNTYVNGLKKQAQLIEKELYEIAGYEFNLKSGKEMSKVLRALDNFKVLLDKNGNELINKNGDLTLNKEALIRYENEYDLPFMKKIVEYNHLSKEISQLGFTIQQSKNNIKSISFFKSEEEVIEDKKGFLASIHNNRLHGGYKLHGTETGRMSGGGGLASTINWQNMPKTKEFRKLFLPSKDCVMVFVDYVAMEVCIFSQISGPGPLENLILNKMDMHCYTCVNLLKLNGIETTYEEVVQKTKIEGQEDDFFVKWRGLSKGTNFQAQYGATGYGISNIFNVSVEEGNKFLNAWYDAYPEGHSYINKNREHAKKYGWVKTLLGRKRRLPQLTYIGKDSFYNKKHSSFDVGNLLNAAINAPVQGTSGQTTIIAMTNIWKEFKQKKLKSRLLINVHDEIVFEIDINELSEACKIIKYWMEYKYYENVENNKVELEVTIKYGEVWSYGHSKEYWDDHPEEWKQCLNNIKERNEINCEKN